MRERARDKGRLNDIVEHANKWKLKPIMTHICKFYISALFGRLLFLIDVFNGRDN